VFTSLLAIVVMRWVGGSLWDKGAKPWYGSIVGAEGSRNLDYDSFFSQTVSRAANTWYGIRRIPFDDMQTVADNLGGAVVELTVGSETADQINVRLDQLEALGYQAILNMYTNTTPTRRPWYWEGSEWVFPQSTIETLQGIAHHPAMLAIYALHEPLDDPGYVSVEQQRELYQLLKLYTDGLPVFTDIATLSGWEERGIELTDGMCDYCCTAPSHFRSDWTSEQCVTETLRRIDADLDTQQRLMPNSQVVFVVNTYSFPDYHYPIRLVTPEELLTVRDHLCNLDQPMMYYPWSHSLYDLTLEDAPQLWPAIAEGCPHPLDKAVDRTEARVGDTLTYTLTVDNGGGTAATAFLVSDTLDADTAFAGVLGSAPGSYGYVAGVLTWTGTVSGLSQVRLTFQATISASAWGAVTNTALFDDGAGGIYSDTVTTFITGGSLDLPDLSGSDKAVNRAKARVGDTLVYTLTMDNSGETATAFLVSDTLDADTAFAGVLGSTSGCYSHAAGVLTWTGTVSGLSQVQLTFQATISASAWGAVTNTAYFDDKTGGIYSDTVATLIVVEHELYLPLVLKNNQSFSDKSKLPPP
jgi:uncharacterized repeat protein (TIGR01451 family)